MRNFTKIIIALGLLIPATACKSDSEKRADKVVDTKNRVAEKDEDLREEMEDVRDEQEDVNEAQAELAQARIDFIKAVDAHLADISAKIAIAKTRPGFDAARVIQLEAEAKALRDEAADNTRVFNTAVKQSELDRIINDMRTELNGE